MTVGRSWRRLRLRYDRIERFVDARQKDFENRPFVELTEHTDMSAALLDNSMASCEAQAGALPKFLGREERLKDSRLHLRRHAHTRIADGDQDVIPCPSLRFDAQTHVLRLDSQSASFGHGVARVYREIQEHLLHLAWIGFYAAEFRLRVCY